MKKYFFSNGKEKNGPFSFEELKNKDIKKETLIWFTGLEDWKRAEEIKEFEEILELIPPPIIVESFETNFGDKKTDELTENEYIVAENLNVDNDKFKTVDECNNFEDTTQHPWRRFFARTVDLFTGGILVFFLFSIAIGYFFPRKVDDFIELVDNPIIAAFVLYLLWIPFEALLISATSTTFAKWIFGIHVRSKTGDNLSYIDALKRVFLVFIQGEGLGIPLITLFTRISAYKRLTKTGTTLWDISVDSVVTYKKWSIVRKISSVFVTIVVLVIICILNSL